MNHAIAKCVCATFLAAVAASAVGAQQPPAAGDGVAKELERLNRQLEDIGLSLRALLANQEAELVVRRIELAERRLAPLDRELRGARADLRNKQSEQRQMQTYRDEIQERLDAAVREASEDEPQHRKEFEMMRPMLENLEAEVQTLTARVFELEDELARGRERVEDLDALLGELLDSGR